MKYIFIFFSVLFFSFTAWSEIEEYVLQPGDVISITVVEHPEFSGKHKIRPDGRINYPVIGEIDVASLTCAQLVKIMQGKLSSYINNPVASVSIEAYYANKIFAIGDIGNPGEYQIYEPIDVLKAIAMCGGINSSRIRQVKIIRADGTIITLNVHDLWNTASKYDTRKYLLYPGDTIYVPKTFQMPWGMLASILSIISIGLTIALNIENLSDD